MVSEISSLSKEELTVLADVVELWEKLITLLGKVEAHPREYLLHIETEVQPGYLGWVGYDESGTVTFQPAPPGGVS
jgi:hypothetical protein